MSDALPALPYEAWQPTKDTLHLYAQIVGKIRMAAMPPRNHWWNVTLYVDERGLTTRRMVHDGIGFSIAFDFVHHRLVVRTDRRAEDAIPLRDGLSVSTFYYELFALLRELGIHVKINAQPYGVPMTTPFADDTEHASYDKEIVGRYWQILGWTERVFEEFAGWFGGKTSPVQLFWHSFDLAVTRFSGRPAPKMEGADPVTHEAYTHEVISFGWWPGDVQAPAPAFYSYTHPEPEGLTAQPLEPASAHWAPIGKTHQARLPWDDVRTAANPRGTLLNFLQSAYAAGARTGDWPHEELHSTWCPPQGRF